MLHRLRLGALAVVVLLASPAVAIEIPDLVPNVVDTTGTLSSDEIERLNLTIDRLRMESAIWGAVLIVDSTGDESIERVADETFIKWELGKRDVDNGLLIVVAKEERTARIEVGYGLESSLTDANASRVIRDILVPNFRDGRFAEGLNAALIACNEIVVNGESALAVDSGAEEEKSYLLPIILWFIIIAIVPALIRGIAVARSSRYAEPLRATPEERSPRRILFLSGVGSFLTMFLLINPGIFFVIFWHESPAIAPVFVPFAYLFLLAANWGYLSMLSERRRAKFRSEPGRAGSLNPPQAFDSARSSSGSGSSGWSSSSSSSSSHSSSSGGGRSGGGGASGSW